jgi:hypothetical protein
MSGNVMVSAVLWIAAVGVLGLYLLRRLRRVARQRRLTRRFKESLQSRAV